MVQRMTETLYSNGWKISAKLLPWLCWGSLSVLFLLAPAFWNGFALVFFDSGGYVCRMLEMNLSPGRSFFYGFFLWVGSLGWQSFWGPILLQSIMCVWCICLTFRCISTAIQPHTLVLLCAILTAFTGISWYTSQLMPDVFISFLVLILWLFSFHWLALSGAERIGLSVIALFALLSHMSAMALALGLIMLLTILAIIVAVLDLAVTVFLKPVITLVLGGMILMPTIHYSIFQHPGYTPGGPAFIFGRLVQDGIATRWLNEHCPQQGIQLCAFKDTLPQTADDFLWADTSPFIQIGGWNKDAEKEMSTIIKSVLKEYPYLFVKTACIAAFRQFVSVATGDGLDEFQPATRGIFSDLLPKTSKSFIKAKQQNNGITRHILNMLNVLHIPMSLAACCILPFVIFWKFYRKECSLAIFCTTILFALAGNSVICGALSNPHDRYQSRIVWLAVFAVLLAFLPKKHVASSTTPAD